MFQLQLQRFGTPRAISYDIAVHAKPSSTPSASSWQFGRFHTPRTNVFPLTSAEIGPPVETKTIEGVNWNAKCFVAVVFDLVRHAHGSDESLFSFRVLLNSLLASPRLS